MLILLTNDDGIQAPGIVAMWRELTQLGDVVVVAPETAQSATGHGITLSAPLLTSQVKIENGFTGTAVDGRPADCVKLAVSQLVPRRPDLVVSGINAGANVGINVIYSGTVAAAIEAAFLGCRPSPRVCTCGGRCRRTSPIAAAVARRTIELVLARGLSAGQVASINVPALRTGEEPAGVRVARQCTNVWADTYDRRQDPRGRDYFWNSSVFTLVPEGNHTDADTDVAGLRDKCVTVTPLQFDLTDHRTLRGWSEGEWRLPQPISG